MANKALFYIKNDTFDIVMDDYPCTKLGWSLDKLSVDGKYRSFPTDKKPLHPWVWTYHLYMLSAVRKLLIMEGIELFELYDEGGEK